MRFLPFALCALLFLSAAPVDAGDDAAPWTGRVVYEQTASGDSDGAKTFRSMAAKRVVVHFAKDMHRQDEEGGMNAGSYIVRADKVGALKLDHTKRRTERGGAMDLEKTDEKVKAIEQIDQHIVGPLLEALKGHGDWRVMISPDHPTFLSTKKHTHGNVPVAMVGAGVTPDACQAYGDTNAAASELKFDQGWDAMRWFIVS